MEVKLTRDAEYMLCALYKSYKDKIKSGQNKEVCRYMHDSEHIQRELMPEWSFEDVDDTCRELDRAGFLDCLYADNVVVECSLKDSAIISMENRFKDGALQLLDVLANLKAIIFS